LIKLMSIVSLVIAPHLNAGKVPPAAVSTKHTTITVSKTAVMVSSKLNTVKYQ